MLLERCPFHKWNECAERDFLCLQTCRVEKILCGLQHTHLVPEASEANTIRQELASLSRCRAEKHPEKGICPLKNRFWEVDRVYKIFQVAHGVIALVFLSAANKN